jgi:hypothetical protein
MILCGMAQDSVEHWKEFVMCLGKGTSLAGMLEYRALLTCYVRVHILPGIYCWHIWEITYLPYTCPFPIL